MTTELSIEVIGESLKDLVGPEDIVVVFSALWTFGHLTPWRGQDLANNLLALILDVCGSSQTVVFPTYTFSFCQSRVFDELNSPSEVGLLSQCALVDQRFSRTRRPIYSYCAYGPRSQEILNLYGPTSWGDESPMGWFENNKARVIVLGSKWERSASLIHRAEEKLLVPYRYFKLFSGSLIRKDQQSEPVQEIMYVRSQLVPPELDYSPATKKILEAPSYRSHREDGLPFESVRADHLVKAAEIALLEDPLSFIVNRQVVQSWMKNTKQAEVCSDAG